MREFVRQIVVSLREDDTWGLDKHWAENNRLGCKVWMANGFWFLHIRWYAERASYGGWGDAEEVYLSLIEKAYIWLACRKLRRLSKQRAEASVLEAIIQRRLTSKETT